jgi:YHS domain-containing protein
MKTVALACLLGAIAGANPADEAAPQAKERAAAARGSAQRELQPFQDWIGAWRGGGQPKRMSNKGAWVEEAEWVWKIGKDRATLRVDIKDGKLLRSGELGYDPDKRKYTFHATLPDDLPRVYSGERDKQGKLVLVSAGDDSGMQYRLTFTMLHADRLLMLAESKPADRRTFARVAEVGYTRKGGSFALAGDSYPKCVVTGGRGTMPVEYKGKTYYVCCTGCKQAFLDDPEAVLAEAAERAKKEAADRKKK